MKLMKRLLNLIMNKYIIIDINNFESFLIIFRSIFNLTYEIYSSCTEINQEWLDNNINKIKNLNEINIRMLSGKMITIFPTTNYINNLNTNIQEIDKIIDTFEREF